ncbi:MAG: hypothetical protein HQ468_03275, partial [Actinomycetales bacterium]|nr:hypothetical protein [Actinomycetales bacterium]
MHSERGHTMSLRFRITLLTAVLISFTSAIIGFATYVTVGSVQLEQVDTTLQTSMGSTGMRMAGPLGLKKGANDFPNPVAIVKVNAKGEINGIRRAGPPRNPDPLPAIPTSLLTPDSEKFASFVDPETNQSYRAASRDLR